MMGRQGGAARFIRTLAKLRNGLVSSLGNDDKAIAHYDIILQRLLFFRLLSALGLIPSNLMSNELSRTRPGPMATIVVQGHLDKSLTGHNHVEAAKAVSSLGLFRWKCNQQSTQHEIDYSILQGYAGALDDLELDGHETKAFPDERVLLLGLLYESMKSRGRKKRAGAFYTPTEIAKLICSRSLDVYLEKWMSVAPFELTEQILSLRVLDNSCGGGVFLLAMLQRLVEMVQSLVGDLDFPNTLFRRHGVDCGSTASVAAHFIRHSLFGADLDQGAVNITEAQLWLALAALNRSLTNDDFRVNLKAGDSLFKLWPKGLSFDLIVGNPPYVRFSSLDPSYRSDIKARYETAREYNIHALFIESAVEQLAPEGVLGYLLHKNLLTLRSYADLRRRLLTNHRIKQISDCGPGVFRGVTAETSIVVLRKGSGGQQSSVSLSKYDFQRGNYASTTSIPQEKYIALVSPWSHRFLTGIGKEDAELLRTLSSLPRLADIASIRRGIETGCNSRFVCGAPKSDGNWQPAIRGRDITVYGTTSKVFLDYDRDRLAKPGRIGLLSKPKILVQQNARNPVACYDEGQYLVLNSATYISEAPEDVLKSICVFVNSNLVSSFFRTVITNNARLTVNLLPNNLGSIPIPESFDGQMYGSLCDVLTILQSSRENSHGIDDVFYAWHDVVAEAAVQAAYFPDRDSSKAVTKRLRTLLKGAERLSDWIDIAQESMFAVSPENRLETPRVLLGRSFT